MARINKRGIAIRDYILNNVSRNPSDIASLAASKFSISRQAVNKHLKKLCSEDALSSEGKSRGKKYKLVINIILWESYPLDGSVREDKVWRETVSPLFKEMPKNVIDVWHYGLTEMFNNAIDHSSGSRVWIELKETAIDYTLIIFDDGEGIFRKIQREMNLDDERHAVLELAKGKFTTDPSNHSGEGIFFSSRTFDHYSIVSGEVVFTHYHDDERDWIVQDNGDIDGTHIYMNLSKNSKTDIGKVFDKFSSGDDKAFSKTIVPVRLAQYGDDKLVSRSQAKRVLVRIERFKEVIFNFKDVESIGQAFADEIFRVFRNKNTHIAISSMYANKQVKGMIQRALANNH
jgi:anti-sigma regulatory factor (Ser/Thr protein kinase)